MNKLLVFIIMNLMSAQQDLKAQDILCGHTSIVVSPFGLVAGHYQKLRLRIQYSAKAYMAYGMDVKYYFETYEGYQLMPFVKFFPAKETMHGVYLYGTGVYGKNNGLPEDKTAYYKCYGIGAGVGVQICLGEQNDGLIDIAFGIKKVENKSALSSGFSSSEYNDYFVIGPVSPFDGIIAIGFSF